MFFYKFKETFARNWIYFFPTDFLINIVFYWTGYIVRKSNIYHHTFLQQNLMPNKVKPIESHK